jgi:hypothetical protein
MSINKKIRDVCDCSTDIGKEILSFLIPDSKHVIFERHSTNAFNTNNSSRYERAFVNNKLVQNKKGLYLSRISKKNGKHRYYITKVTIDENEVEYNDSIITVYYHEYSSNYIGKNLEHALLLFA